MLRIPKVLVAYDGSACAKTALAGLRFAGLESNVQARVLTVSDLWIPPVESIFASNDALFRTYAMERGQPEEALKEARILAGQGAAALRKDFPDWKISSDTALDAVAQGILHYAEKWKPALIVLGSQGHTMLERVLLGSVSHKVLKHAGCNVRIVRKSRTHPVPAARVLLAVDGSKNANSMVECVARRSWSKEAEFRVVVVLDYQLSLIQDSQTDSFVKSRVRGVPFQGRLSERLAEKAVYTLAERGLTVTSVVREGDPRIELVKEVKRFKANSLFIGRRGLHGVQRFFLGRVSTALAEHAPCTVEVTT